MTANNDMLGDARSATEPSAGALSRDIVVLHRDDNIVVATRTLRRGQRVAADECEFTVIDEIRAGHKVCARAIFKSEKVVKYGAPIGSAIRDIKVGEHVHTHNMQSDYIAGHSRSSSGSVDAVKST